jgi:outer membrane autotransporter protein
MSVGIDKNYAYRLNAGLMFGYGEPQMDSAFGRIKAYDYTLGLYSKLRLSRAASLNSFVGYGRQRYDYARQDTFGSYDAKYDGSSLFTSVELALPRHTWKRLTLAPIVGLDYQAVWTDGFTENGTGPSAQRIDSACLDRLVLRTGMNSKLRMTNSLDFNARLQYGYQAAGTRAGNVNSVFVATPDLPAMNLRGVDLGCNQWNVGAGFQRYFGVTKRAYLHGNYDFDRGDRSASHTGQLGLVWLF